MLPTTDTGPPNKRRKKERACDACRRRKTKLCTYVEASKPRGPPKAYVTELEDKVEALEALLEQVRPGVDFSGEIGPRIIRDSWRNEPVNSPSVKSFNTSARDIPNHSSALAPTLPFGDRESKLASHSFAFEGPRSSHLTFHSHSRAKRTEAHTDAAMTYRNPHDASDDESTTGTTSSSSDTEEIVITSLIGRTKITLRGSDDENSAGDNNIRFHGRSSTAGLVEATRQFKYLHLQDSSDSPPPPDNTSVAQMRRPQFWKTPAWEMSPDYSKSDTPEVFLSRFPPEELAALLIDLYFQHSNTVFPLLHRPTFNRHWKEELHRRHIWFACVCASIFAIASRWCSDERVLPAHAIGASGEIDWTKAGLDYLDIAMDIQHARKSLFHPASLFEVQSSTLVALYLAGTHEYPTGWMIASSGIRKAQDVGAHRKKVYRTESNVDDELWKRAFWHLVVLDRLGGAHLGRACALAEEDFDLDLPLEVDDDYWEDRSGSSERFKQPPGKPSLVTAFNELIKLTQIMAFAIRTLYAIDRSKFYRALVPVEKGSLIKQLSFALDEWKDKLPDHLKMPRNLDESIYSTQITTLHFTYHLTRMLIYRSLLPTSLPKTPTRSYTLYRTKSRSDNDTDIQHAAAISADAAKACADIIRLQIPWGINHFYVPGIINVAFLCAALLIGDIWSWKLQERDAQKVNQDVKPPLSRSIQENYSAIDVFIHALKEARDRWEIVNPLLQVLDGLYDSGLNLESPPPPAPIKSGTEGSQRVSELSSISLVDIDNQRTQFGHRVRSTSSGHPSLSSNPMSMEIQSFGHPSVEHGAKMFTRDLDDLRQIQTSYNRPQVSSSNAVHSSMFPGVRSRATSISTDSTKWREQAQLPSINTSMKRTSFPNLYKMNAPYISQERISRTGFSSHTSSHIDMESSPEARLQDVNMHVEHEMHPQPHSNHHGHMPPPALPPKYMVRDPRRAGGASETVGHR
ncbi:hypothetical protein CPC08DRAFT_758708 [Agrocybe pediades]|nr:hypothetical protein CPC08DRAFT_758708 [Agrocybe pediades]